MQPLALLIGIKRGQVLFLSSAQTAWKSTMVPTTFTLKSKQCQRRSEGAHKTNSCAHGNPLPSRRRKHLWLQPLTCISLVRNMICMFSEVQSLWYSKILIDTPALAITVSTRPYRIAISRARAAFPSTSADTHLIILTRSGYASASKFSSEVLSGVRTPAKTKASSFAARICLTKPSPLFHCQRAPREESGGGYT